MVKIQQPSANGVTYGTAGREDSKRCVAEFEATGANADPNWETCLLSGIMYLILYKNSDIPD